MVIVVTGAIRSADPLPTHTHINTRLLPRGEAGMMPGGAVSLLFLSLEGSEGLAENLPCLSFTTCYSGLPSLTSMVWQHQALVPIL